MSDPMDDMIAALARLADLPEEAARLGAPLVEAAMKKTAAAGTTPDGTPWVQKKDGTRPLVNAAAALTTTSHGTVITTKLAGVSVLHNWGTHKDPKRQIIPDRADAIPATFAAAVKAGADAAFDKAMGGT